MARLRVLGENPPPPRGNGENQLRELRDYIMRLKDELEFLLTHLGEDNMDDQTQERIRGIEEQGSEIKTINAEIENINTALAEKDDADRFLVVDTGSLTLADQTWTSWSSGRAYGILMLEKPDGYHPISANLCVFSGWVPGANLFPFFSEASGNTYLVSEVDAATLGSSAKAGLRIVLEKD